MFVGTIFLPYEYKSMLSLHFYKSPEFQPFQIVTSMFMHANIMHLVFNMFTLYFIGPYTERTLGSKRFLILYLVAGFGATALHVGINVWEYSSILPSVPQEAIDTIVRDGRQAKLPSVLWNMESVGKFAGIYLGSILGASGCTSGVVLAFSTMFPNLKMMIFPIPVPLAAKYIAVLFIVGSFYLGISGGAPGIAHFAHLGGAIIGFLMVKYWNMNNLR